MNIFKKVFVCLMAVLLLSLFVACDEGNDGEEQGTDAATTTVSQTDDNGKGGGITVMPDQTTATSSSTSTSTSTTTPTGTTSADDIKPGGNDNDWGEYNPI